MVNQKHEKLTSIELSPSAKRVMDAISFKTPDRLPRWDNIAVPPGTWGLGFVDKWRKWKNFSNDVMPEDYYKIDVSESSAKEGPFFSREGLIEKRGKEEIRRYSWGNTIRVTEGGYFFQTLKNAVENPSDIDKLEFEDAGDDRRYGEYLKRVQAERKAGRLAFIAIGGIYCRSQFIRGEDKLLMDMATNPGLCRVLFEKVSEYLTKIAIELLTRTNSWDTGIWVSDDCANSLVPMFSPDMWEKYLLYNYRKMINTLREQGCKHFFFHSDGNIGPLMDLLLQAGFEGFNPLEPRCGIDLVKLRERYGKKMFFFGGICNTRILPKGNNHEIEKMVMPLIELGKDGGLIIGSASIGDDIEPEAYDYYIGLLDKYGNY
jgi:hypothetical protein